MHKHIVAVAGQLGCAAQRASGDIANFAEVQRGPGIIGAQRTQHGDREGHRIGSGACLGLAIERAALDVAGKRGVERQALHRVELQVGRQHDLEGHRHGIRTRIVAGEADLGKAVTGAGHRANRQQVGRRFAGAIEDIEAGAGKRRLARYRQRDQLDPGGIGPGRQVRLEEEVEHAGGPAALRIDARNVHHDIAAGEPARVERIIDQRCRRGADPAEPAGGLRLRRRGPAQHDSHEAQHGAFECGDFEHRH